MKITITLSDEYTLDVLKSVAAAHEGMKKPTKKDVIALLSTLVQREIDNIIAKTSKP